MEKKKINTCGGKYQKINIKCNEFNNNLKSNNRYVPNTTSYLLYVQSNYIYNQSNVVIHGKNGKEALKTVMPYISFKRGGGKDVTVKLTPVIVKGKELHQHPTKRSIWYSVINQ